MAAALPQQTEKALDKLLQNSTDKGTVVRWSTAFALGEIAKHNPNSRKKLLPKIREILKKETNNGVKNVYLKTLKAIEKES